MDWEKKLIKIKFLLGLSTGPVEYVDCISTEG